MIYPATQAVLDHFQSKGIRCRLDELDNASLVQIPFSGKNVTNIILYIISKDDSTAVNLRTMPLARVPEGRSNAVLQVLNACNLKYRYVKFSLDNERDILAQYDVPLRTSMEEIGDICEEILARFGHILDECHPEIMKAIYAEFVIE